MRIRARDLFSSSQVVVMPLLWLSPAFGIPTFDSYIQFPTAGTNCTGIACGDFDADGDPDVFTSHRVTNNVMILLNDGDGNFTSSLAVGVGLTPRYVRIGDFNNDNWPDFSTPDYNSDTVSIVLHDGSGGMQLTQTMPIFTPAILDVADMDLDGDIDIIVPHWDESAGQPSQSPSLVTVLLNDGSGNFTIGSSGTIGVQPRGMDIADFNHDDYPDVVVCNLASSTQDVLINAGDGSFLPSIVINGPHQPREVVAGDWNDDDEVDFATVSKGSNTIHFYMNDGLGGFIEEQNLATLSNPHSCDAHDLDGDGDLDVIASHVSSAYMSIYVNDGGIFSPSTNVYSPSGGAEVITCDVNVDGREDILTANTNNATISVHLNDTEFPVEPCYADLDENQVVDVLDLLLVIAFWGPCQEGSCRRADLLVDDVVDILDLLVVLAEWGSCIE